MINYFNYSMKKKLILIIIFLILITGIIGTAYAAKDKTDSSTSNTGKGSKAVIKEEKTYTFIDENQKEIQVTLRKETKTKDGETYEKIKVRGVDAVSQLELEEEHEEKVLKKVKMKLSNGNYREVKIMPNRASETAVEKLKTNKNLTIQLKEVGVGNNLSVVYDIEGNRTTKLLGLFKVRAQLKARVDAETGEIIEFETPWWYFLVGKEVVVPQCSIEHLELCENQEECEAAGGYWYDELCNVEPQIVCSIEHLELCENQEECEAAGGYWYDKLCNIEPQINQTAI
jgi:hypothetical protein